MNITTSVWQLAVIALIAGAFIGALVYRLLSPSVKQAEKTKTDLQQAHEELASYKLSVGQHFEKTSELVDDLAKDYVKVYQHLAEGAQTLGDSKVFNKLLKPNQGQISIAVDDTANDAADNSLVDPEVTNDLPAQSADEHAEPEPLTQPGKEALSPESLANESTQTEVSKSSENPDQVDVAESPVENTDTDAKSETADTTTEGKKKTI